MAQRKRRRESRAMIERRRHRQRADWYDFPESRIGERLGGRFELQRKLGRGGYAVTYLATDLTSRAAHQVVVKLFYIRPNEDPVDKFRRFIVEAAALDHLIDVSGVVMSVGTGQRLGLTPQQITFAKANELRDQVWQGLDLFTVLEFMSGGSLADRIRRGSLGERKAAEIVYEVAHSVATIHQFGLIHRDLTPPNILFGSDNRPKVTDFGLARFDPTEGPQAGTMPFMNQPLGTPGYMPRESYMGLDTEQRDVYSLGVMLIESAVGTLRPPQDRTRYEAWRPTIAAGLQRIESQPLRQIAAKAVADQYGERYVKCADLAHDLEQFLRTLPLQVHVPPIQEHVPPLQVTVPPVDEPWVTQPPVDPVPTNRAKRPFRLPAIRNPLPALTQKIAWERPALAFVVGGTIATWLSAWPDFYGANATVGLMLLAGGLAYWRPIVGHLAAMMLITLLASALSPFAGGAALLVMLVTWRRWRKRDVEAQRQALLMYWSIALTPLLAPLELALLVPLLIGASSRKLWRGGLAGVLTYMMLSVWATFHNVSQLGNQFIFNSVGRGAWFIDFNIRFELFYDGFVKPFHFGELLWEAWTTSPTPLIGVVVWGLMGTLAALAAQLYKRRSIRPSMNFVRGS